MKILISSHAFAPSIGGIEQSTLDLSQAFLQIGHEVRIVTQTQSQTPIEDDKNLLVIRRPNVLELVSLVNWCDVYFHNNISIRSAWPLFLIWKPWIVTSQTWISSRLNSNSKLKRLVLSKASNIFISEAVRQHVNLPGVCIPNPYNSKIFRIMQGITRTKDLVFVGRLVSDKGCDLLITALRNLKNDGLTPKLSIIGDGPELLNLELQVKNLGLENQVCFKGVLKGESLASQLNQHRIMVVPSLWNEPFGIVALEGIACGCAIVASSGGGLPDAVGPCGITFTNGVTAELTTAIQRLMTDADLLETCTKAAKEHLCRHNLERIAWQYLEVFKRATAL